MNISPIIFILCLLFIGGCNYYDSGHKEGKKVAETMERVRELSVSMPDSALAVLYTVEEKELSNRRERAHYSLLLSELLDKNYMDLETDSIIRPAVMYFSRHGKQDDRAKMYYYLGRIHENAGHIEKAVEAFVAAGENVTDEQYRLQGLIYSHIGYLYEKQLSTEEAIEMFSKASDAFSKANDLRNLCYCLEKEGDIYFVKNQEKASLRYYQALDIAKQLKDTVNILYLIHGIATNLVFHFKNIEGAKELLVETYEQYHVSEIPFYQHFLWGYIYLQEKDLQKAEYYLTATGEQNPNPHAVIGYQDLQRMLHKEKKEYRKALEYAEQAIELRDSTYSLEKEALVQRWEGHYRTELLRAENRNLQNMTLYLVIIFLLLFSFFVYIGFQFRYRTKRKMQEKEERILSLKGILDDWINFLKILGKMAVATKKQPEQFLETFKENLYLKSGKKHFFSDLHRWVNQSHHGIVDYLKKKYPRLTNEDLDFCCLLYLKMPVDVMLLMYDYTNKNSLYNKRSELRKKLNIIPEEDLEQYLEQLLEKRA